MEIVVRDGRFFTIGDNGAEFFSYKKGDVIFNAEQSKQILEKGKITHGRRRGTAMASGTAMAEGNAFLLTSTSGNDGGGTKTNTSTKKKSKKKKKGHGGGGDDDDDDKKKDSSSSSSSKEKQQIDWIEIAIKRAERAVKNLKTAAENAYDTVENRNKALAQEIASITSEIGLQQRAFAGYAKAARSVGLRADLAKKVQNGTIEVTKYDSDTQKKIKEYQDLYEKLLKAKDAVDELRIARAKLYKDRFDNVKEKWESQISEVEYQRDKRESRISQRSDRYGETASNRSRQKASRANISDYNAQIANAQTQKDLRNKEVDALREQLRQAVYSGNVKKGSEQYNSMVREIRSAQSEVDKLNEDIIDNTNKIADEYRNMFDVIQTGWDNSISNLEQKYDVIEGIIERRTDKASEYVSINSSINASKKNAADYKKLVANEQKQIKGRRKERAELLKALSESLKSGAVKKGSEEYYDMLSEIRDVTNEINDLSGEIIENTNNIAKEYVNAFEKIETKYENNLSKLVNANDRAESRIQLRNAKADEFNTYGVADAASRKNITDYRKVISNTNKQINVRKKQVTDLRNQLNSALKSGAVKKYSESYYEMLSTIQDKQGEIDKLNESLIDNARNIAEEYKNMFEHTEKRFNNIASIYSHFTSAYNTALDLATAKGYATSERYALRLMKVEESKAKNSKKLADELQKKLNAGVKAGAIKVYSQAWYDMTNEILKAREATNEATLSVQKYANEVRKIKWDKFDYLQDSLSAIRDESDFLIDLMDVQDAFDDSGNLTKYGMATIGLHTMNYDSYLNQVKRYASEIKSINQQLANDPSNTDLIERRKDLIETQRDMILASQKEKKSIRDLVEDGIDKEIDALDDLIDKYLDALDSQKDLYDYQKKVKDKAEEIASLQKQLNAYSGDKSTEALAKIQKITKDLKEAEEDLKETEYDKYISDSKKMLNDMKDDYEKRMNERLDNLDALIAEVSADVNRNAKDIGATLSEQANAVGYTISDTVKNVWTGARTIMTSTNMALTSITQYVKGLWSAADKISATLVNNAQKEYDKTKPKKYASGSRRIPRNQMGWTNESGQELIYQSGSGAILTPLGAGDKVFTSDMTDTLWNISKNGGIGNLISGISHGSGGVSPSMYNSMRGSLSGRGGITQNFENITFSLPNVRDYDSLVRQMQNDNKFEQLVQSMTIGRLNGKQKSAKRHIII